MATVNDVLIRVRRKIGDMQKLRFSDPELIEALNDAIDSISGELIAAMEPEMIKSFTLSSQSLIDRPKEYVTFVGQYPIQFVTDNTGKVSFKHIDPDFYGTLDVRYYATKPKIAAPTDTIPFDKEVHRLLLVDRTASAFMPAQPAK